MPRNVKKQIASAISLFRRFREAEPEFLDSHEFKTPKVGMVIGECDGVMYETTHKGKKVKYLHRFKKGSRPLLVSSWDGSQLLFVGGRYNMTEDGIVDK